MRAIDIRLGAALDPHYDLFIGAVGYEGRSVHCLQQLRAPKRVLALGFGFHHVLDYPRNRKVFEEARARIIQGEDEQALPQMLGVIAEASREERRSGPLRIGVDISVMSRAMMANVVLALDMATQSESILVQSLYSPAQFEPPEPAPPMKIAGPVLPDFAGWSSRPDSPLNLIMGLGYEEDLAVGAVAYLEPNHTYLFLPKGIDTRYEPYVEDEAAKLSSYVQINRQGYDLSNWPQAINALERLAGQLVVNGRVVIVPFGPKVFAWNALCISRLDGFQNVSVWRFSAGQDSAPKNRSAEGEIFSLTALFS